MHIGSSASLRAFLAACVLLSPAGSSPAEREPVKEVDPESVRVRLVQIPVEVTRGDEPIPDLGLDDFVLEDEGRRQKILSVDVLDHAATVTGDHDLPGIGVPVSARRHVLLLVDMTNATGTSLRRAVSAAEAVLENGLYPNDLVAVAIYRDSGGLQPLVEFTPDRQQALAALRTVGAPDATAARPDPLGLTLYEPSRLGAPARTGLAGDAVGIADAELLDSQERAISAERRTALRQMEQFAAGLKALGELLGSVPARKHVVLLSEGFDNSLITATESRARMEAMNTARERGEIWNVQSQERFGDASRISTLDAVVESMQRADCVVHAVDVGSMLDGASDAELTATSAGQRSTRQNQGLTLLAAGTGGRYVLPSSDLVESVGTILESTSFTYVLSYAPDRIESDGKWHRVKVKVPGVRGARVSARPGYFAPSANERPEGTRRRLDLAGRLMDGNAGGDFEAASMAVSFATDTAEALVPVITEIDGPSLMRGRTLRDPVALELYVYAQDDTGAIRDLFTQQLTIDPVQAGADVHGGGVKHYGTLQLPAGRHLLRVLVVETASGRSHLGLFGVEVPDPDTQRMTVTQPLVPDAATNWVLARYERTGEDGEQLPFPFYADDMPFLPSAVAQGPADGRWPVSVLVRNLGSEVPEVRGQLQDGAGRWSRPIAASRVRRLASGIGGYDTLTFDLPRPPDGAVGLRITVVDAESGRSASSEVALGRSDARGSS